jgi:hypothetical protein
LGVCRCYCSETVTKCLYGWWQPYEMTRYDKMRAIKNINNVLLFDDRTKSLGIHENKLDMALWEDSLINIFKFALRLNSSKC